LSEILVVGLGQVPTEQIRTILGDGYTFIAEPTEQDLAKAEGAIVRAEYAFDEAAFRAMPNLKLAVRTGVGVDRVDLKAASSAGVAIAITPGANSHAVAEGALAMMLSLTKKLAPLTDLVRKQRWAARDEMIPGDLEGSTLGLIGYGRIGKRVAELAQAFGMKVIAYDPAAEVPIELKAFSLDELLRDSNYVSVHVPLTDQTRDLISTGEISQLPDGAIIINVSRGGIVNLDAAHDALVSGKLAGLGLDSFDPEPAVWHKCFDLSNVVLTPHVMGLSERAREQTFEAAAYAIRHFFEETGPVSVVNPK
jgi:phosphoglycerate dehydrogenase-like enzyme